MDYNSYGGGQYSTTSYGAQGGAGGGGFMGGSQGGSQASPAGKGTYGKDTLRPVTIKQLLDAQQPHPDAEFKIDDVEITQVTFVGQIRNISTQTTNITYKLDDGTGTVEVKQWVDSDATTSLDDAFSTTTTSKPKLTENEYARVWGRLKAFNNKRHVGAHVVRPITDKNEIQYHLLEATFVHLYFSRGPPEQFSKAAVDGANGKYGQPQQMGYDQNGADAGTMNGRKMPNVSPGARRVYGALKTTPQNNEGLHVQNIAATLGMQIADVMKAGDELLSHGMIFTTVDDNTWAILEF
ncbi:MAG: replication factor A2 [Lasallia pustulata]|uniref:Replication factor A2 n=1 Tax=Lasallia pustulata TaxID=136370 RepID=A0A5M8PF57_9LECA|nr:MAG: replication factor A2 [Lasallia pustulata]